MRVSASRLFPKFDKFINDTSSLANSTWGDVNCSGKDLEFITGCKLVEIAEKMGCSVAIDDFYSSNPHCYYLRNEVPYHFGSKAGHEGNNSFQVSLEDKFVAALTPKAVIQDKTTVMSVFREGVPYHMIMRMVEGGSLYRLRPDYAIVEGRFDISYIGNGKLMVNHITTHGVASIEIAVKNSDVIPVTSYNIEGDYAVNVLGIVECSLQKGKEHVDNQLDEYKSLFSNDIIEPYMLFVNASSATSKYDTINIARDNLLEGFQCAKADEKLRLLIGHSLEVFENL